MCGRETRGVGDGTGVNTGHVRQLLVGHLGDNHRDAHAQRHIHQCHDVHGQAALLERAEESGPHLQTHGGDEEDKAEFLDDVQHVVVACHTERTQANADKEHPCDAQGDALDLDFAQQQSQEYGDGKHQDSGADC